MFSDRRTFLRASSLAVFAAALSSPSHVASAAKSAASLTIPLTDADRQVLAWVGSYSARQRLIGGSVVSKLRGGTAASRIVVEVADLDALQVALANVPFTNVFSAQNTLSFTQGDEEFIVENLLPELYVQRLTALRVVRNVTFAHEMLSLDPTTQAIDDPRGALSSPTLKIVHAGKGISDAFRTVLRGWVQARELNLKAGADFSQLRSRILSVPGKRRGLAEPVVITLVEQLTELADALTSEKIEDVLRSPLVSQAIDRVLGVSVRDILTQFSAIQQLGMYSDAVAWLASVLSRPLSNSTLPDWLSGLDAVKAYRARTALSAARELALSL